MKLDREINENGKGKYALLNLRTNKIEWGDTKEDEFFVIKLKDINAAPALRAYAESASKHDSEWGLTVNKLAIDAEYHPLKKIPD